MCKVTIDDKINPNFILYNLVFSSNPLPIIDVKNIVAYLKEYGVEMDESYIQEKLKEWYNVGLLRRKMNGHYVVA